MNKNRSAFVDIILHNEQTQPDKAVYSFVNTKTKEFDPISNGKLGARVRSLAAVLQERNLYGERVVLALPHDANFIYAFYACLAVGAIAVPVPPYRSGRDDTRILSVVGDCSPLLVLCEAENTAALQLQTTLSEQGATCEVASVTGLDGNAELYQRPDLKPETLAVIQYTSGSTGDPKGVMISNGNFLHNCARIESAAHTTSSSRSVTWLPFFHDMGLVGCVLQPAYTGGEVTIMTPQHFLKAPMDWIQLLSDTRSTVAVAPNFAFELICDRATPAQISALDLSSIEVVLNGSEPINPNTLRRFADKFKSCGFRWQAFLPTYGLAESTLMATGHLHVDSGPKVLSFDANRLAVAGEAHLLNVATPTEPSSSEAALLVGSGPGEDLVCIVDPETKNSLSDKEVGEIWLSGESIAQGYWNRPDVTSRNFGQRPADDAQAGPYYRTGDLGFLHDGELFITGRLKDLIIVRGRNHAPQDIEETLTRVDDALSTGAAAAFSYDKRAGEEVVAIVELTRGGLKQCADPAIVEALMRRAREAVFNAHDLSLNELRIVKPLRIPRTTSGKIQRQQVKSLWSEGGLDAYTVNTWIKPTDEVSNAGDDDAMVMISTRVGAESWLLKRLAAVSGIAQHEIALDAPFAGYGLDSMTAVSLVNDLDKRTPDHISVDPVDLYDYPTIDTLLAHLFDDEPESTDDVADETSEFGTIEDEAAALKRLLGG